MKIKKRKLLLGLLLSIFLTLPTTCNAEELPPIKWEDIIINSYTDTSYINDALYSINNDILVIHNSSKGIGNYIRLYNSSGEMKWEYTQNTLIKNYSFLINNEYLGFIEFNENNTLKSISLLDLKNGKFTKNIDIENKFKDLDYYL